MSVPCCSNPTTCRPCAAMAPFFALCARTPRFRVPCMCACVHVCVSVCVCVCVCVCAIRCRQFFCADLTRGGSPHQEALVLLQQALHLAPDMDEVRKSVAAVERELTM